MPGLAVFGQAWHFSGEAERDAFPGGIWRKTGGHFPFCRLLRGSFAMDDLGRWTWFAVFYGIAPASDTLTLVILHWPNEHFLRIAPDES